MSLELPGEEMARDERGAVAIIVALLIVVFGGFVALVVDIGYMYETRRQLQSAADAGALAGMQDKITGASDGDVLATAEDYARKNEFPVDRDTPRSLIMLGAPDTVVAENYVKVTVEKQVDLFFAPILELIPGVAKDYDQGIIHAQARAKRVYLTGSRGMMPWAMSTIEPTRVAAEINGGETELSSTGGNTWSGTIDIPVAPGSSGYPVNLKLYNDQDFPEAMDNAASVTVHASGDALSNAYFEDPMVLPGESSFLYVAASEAPKARVNNKNITGFEELEPGLYRKAIVGPDISDAFKSFAVDITVGAKTWSNASRLLVRKNSYPVEDVKLSQYHFAEGGGRQATVTVEFDELEYGEEYNLKVLSDPESGNFQALDFRYVTHSDGTQEGLNDSAADYYENLAGPYPGVIHIGDVITTKTGGLSAPVSTSNLSDRFSTCSLTFSQWEAAGKPPDCTRLVLVPIVERIERITGQSDVIVSSIAVFYVEDYESSGGERVNITGRFIEYAKPGTYQDDPPDSGLYTETARLEMTDY